jgi:glycosyltransferase involved in cell wall biosynthesis
MPVNVTVKYHGEIEPSKVQEALKDSHVFILPSKSENFGHAIYEALATGRPVITSDHTPWKSLQNSKAGINVALENNVGLSDAIILFANMTQEEYNLWSNHAERYAANAINFEDIKNQYKKMFTT